MINVRNRNWSISNMRFNRNFSLKNWEFGHLAIFLINVIVVWYTRNAISWITVAASVCGGFAICAFIARKTILDLQDDREHAYEELKWIVSQYAKVMMVQDRSIQFIVRPYSMDTRGE